MQRYKCSEKIRGEVYSPLYMDGKDVHGTYYFGDVLDVLKVLVSKYEGKVQLIYMDPPFFTGQVFRYQQRVGEGGWKGDRDRIISHIAYIDRYDREEFFATMKEIFSYAHKLLSVDGSLYVHIDYRTSAYLKVMLDDIFGEENFLNEIIWHYKSGGRAKKYFSRKHDNILFYRKSKEYYFDIEAVGVPRGTDRRNNMKKNIDDDGKVYWSIKSAGKEYRYYADDKIYPSDVWDDIPHLHQKNPERTGYDTQKPEALLERIVLASSRPGDIVADFFAGSGTTLAVAQSNGRSWIGVDNSIFSLHTCRRRLIVGDTPKEAEFLYCGDSEHINVIERELFTGLRSDEDDYIFHISDFVEDVGIIDFWSVGYVKDGIYNGVSHSMRTQYSPDISMTLVSKAGEGRPCVQIVDVYGHQTFYKEKRE